uniref:APOBEC1 complementation factor n=1 Tax=Periophthalmus magnuspinnatus TaxID=409849 RepID=A0A3B4AGS4_9GOBI
MESNQKADGLTGTQREAGLRALTQRTGYSLKQENGQRRYGGPPPNWDGPPPERGSEIFVGKLPRDLFEDELVPLCEKFGQIYEVRMMMDFNGNNRGYAFVTFGSRQEAKNAMKQLNNHEIRPGRLLGVCPSVDNCRLFVGGIPKCKRREEILSEVSKVTEGVSDVIVYPSAADKTKNRGFAFVEYQSHRAAAMARRKLLPGRIQLWGHAIAVDWAEPEVEVDEETMATVKILYVRNLMLQTTEETIQKEFNSVKPGAVERVKKIRDYAFVHFTHREDAVNAMNQLHGKVIDGSPIEVTLAKPVDKDSYVRYTRGTGGRGATLQPDYATYTLGQVYDPSMAYLGAPVFYAPQAYAIPAQLRLPKTQVCGRGLVRTPSVRGGGVSGRVGGGVSSNPAYKMDSKQHQDKLFDLLPGMELTPLKTVLVQSWFLQVLEELCQKNGWGSPVYELHSAQTPDQRQLFLYKVTIPALASQYPNTHPVTPSKLCSSVEEARVHAAEHTLSTLGLAEIPDQVSGSGSGPGSGQGQAYPLAAAASMASLKPTLSPDLTYASYDGYSAFTLRPATLL